MSGRGEWTTPKLLRNLVRWQPFSESQRDTIRLWTLLSKTRTFLAELLCFAEREWRSKRYSTTSKAGETLEDFLEGFPTVSRESAVAALEEAKHLLLARP